MPPQHGPPGGLRGSSQSRALRGRCHPCTHETWGPYGTEAAEVAEALTGRRRPESRSWIQTQSNLGPCVRASLGSGTWLCHSGNPLVAPFKATPARARPHLKKTTQSYVYLLEPAQNMGFGSWTQQVGPACPTGRQARYGPSGWESPPAPQTSLPRFPDPGNGDRGFCSITGLSGGPDGHGYGGRWQELRTCRVSQWWECWKRRTCPRCTRRGPWRGTAAGSGSEESKQRLRQPDGSRRSLWCAHPGPRWRAGLGGARLAPRAPHGLYGSESAFVRLREWAGSHSCPP